MGGGQILQAQAAGFEGAAYRYIVDIAVHEDGHALGRHHTPDPVTGKPNPSNAWNKANSIMSYGYSAWAKGDKIGGMKPNPLLAIPEEIETWRQHAINHEIPERSTATDPGWADDLVLMRRQDIDALYDELETGNGRGRLLFGALAGELNDPIE